MSRSFPPTPDQLFPGLFESVQRSQVFEDSKTFVDCTPKRPASEIMVQYNRMKSTASFDLKGFVLYHFDLPVDRASGFAPDPARSAADHVEALWPYLKRSGGSAPVQDDSLIPLPGEYVVPGGRFGEIYYWDSYFTMCGLAVSGEWQLIEAMVDNFAFQIERFGHIPNGNRTYFLSRSQPPFFVFMVELLAQQQVEIVLVNTRPLAA